MFRRRRRDEDEWDAPDDGWANERWDGDEDESRRRRPGRWLLLVALLALIAATYLIVGRDRPAGPSAGSTPTRPGLLAAGGPGDVLEPIVLPTTVPATAPPIATAPANPALDVYDPAVLAEYMLRLLNADRAAYGLAPLAPDETAMWAGALHSADMVARGYFAHWNTGGLGPDHRYALLGGEHAVMENLHSFTYTFEDGGGAPIEDWPSVIQQAQAGLMLSPGHRATILDPAHTHVGIGMAYDPASGEFRLAQEFTNQYATLTIPPPTAAAAGQTIRVAGHVADGPLSNLILSLAFEPWPEPMSLTELARTSVYSSVAESVDARQVARQFDEQLTLGGPGLYHLRLFADLPGGQALVVDRVIQVR